MVKCEKCGTDIERGANFFDHEIVCEMCGAAYCLEYLGYYPEEGSNDRVDEGFEDKEWLEKYKEKNENG